MITRIRNSNGNPWITIAKMNTNSFGSIHCEIKQAGTNKTYYNDSISFVNTEKPINYTKSPADYQCNSFSGVRQVRINNELFLELLIVWNEWCEPENDIVINCEILEGSGFELLPAVIHNDNWNNQMILNEGLDLHGGTLIFTSGNKDSRIYLENGGFFKFFGKKWGYVNNKGKKTTISNSKNTIIPRFDIPNEKNWIVTAIIGSISGVSFERPITITTFMNSHYN